MLSLLENKRLYRHSSSASSSCRRRLAAGLLVENKIRQNDLFYF